MKILFVAVPIAVLFPAQEVLADGLPFNSNRYAGPTTMLRLTPEQVAKVTSGRLYEKGSRDIQLTPRQKATLHEAVGFSPETIEVWTLEEAKDTCSCELLNFGIRMGLDLIEIPHRFLGETWDDRGRFESQGLRSDRRYWVSGALSGLVLILVASLFVRSLWAKPHAVAAGVGERVSAA